MRLTKLLAAALMLAALGGCATAPLPAIDNWNDYQSQLAQLQHWQLSGKLGVRMAANAANSKRGGSAYLNWEQNPAAYAIRLSGPLGQGTTWIRGDDGGVSLEQAGQAAVRADSPEALVAQTLGWELPIGDLFYWVRGIPAPRAPIAQQAKHPSGSLAQLQQSGWQLDFSRYNAVGPWQLPGKIVAHRDGLRLTLIIKNWQL